MTAKTLTDQRGDGERGLEGGRWQQRQQQQLRPGVEGDTDGDDGGARPPYRRDSAAAVIPAADESTAALGNGKTVEHTMAGRQERKAPKKLLPHRTAGREAGEGKNDTDREEEKAEAVVVRAHRVAGWEQVTPVHGRSSSSGSGRCLSGRSEGRRKRSRSPSSSSSSSSSGEAARVESGGRHREERREQGQQVRPQQRGDRATCSDGDSIGRQRDERDQQWHGDFHRPSPGDSESGDGKSRSPAVGAETGRIPPAWRPLSPKPQVVTHEEMPRDHTQTPAKSDTSKSTARGGGRAAKAERNGAARADSRGEGGGDGDGRSRAGRTRGELEEREDRKLKKKKKKKKKKKMEKKMDESRGAESESGQGHGAWNARCDGDRAGDSGGAGGVPSRRSAESGGASPQAVAAAAAAAAPLTKGEGATGESRNGTVETSAVPERAPSAPLPAPSADGGGGAVGVSSGASAGAGPAGRGTNGGRSGGHGGAARRKDTLAAGGSFRRAGTSRGQRGAGRQAQETGPVTYVTHDQTAVEEGDHHAHAQGHWAAGASGSATSMCDGGGGSPPPPLTRRTKRPRPKLRGASARAVVWGEPCPSCRQSEQSAAGGGAEEVEVAGGGGCGRPCRSGRGDGEGESDAGGQGLVKPGQYLYLRAPAPEDLRRSLVSEGEFGVPRAGGLSGSALDGDRVRVWRGSGGGEGGGSYAEADVVQFNPTSGKHRLRFVEDGVVEDVKLTDPLDDGGRADGDDGPRERAPGDGVRWLQRRARRRARDAIRRNLNGLCRGPSGELRGLVGDEHDPSYQRQENWRWALGRWRWNLGERDGYSTSDDGRSQGGGGGDRGTDPAGVPLAGDGMFPPIGRVLAVERRYVDTGERVIEGDTGGGSANGVAEEAGAGRATEVLLKVARLWYPQDTRGGMDPFVHGKAEVFEACRIVCPGTAEHVAGDRARPPDSGCGHTGTATSKAGQRGGKGQTGDRDTSLPGDARRESGIPSDRTSAVSAPLLDAEQPLAASMKIEPVTLWVRACEAHRLASVHPCIDGRLNPCAGKVVNDPYQPQAEFFISHRYCLEADAYFPLESPRNNSSIRGGACSLDLGSLGSPGGARDGGGGSGGGGLQRLPSPRSTKARLLNRRVSDSMLDLPPKWHPLKKRVSLDQGSGSPAGSGRDSPVVGWESAVGRSGRADSGASSSGGRSAPAEPASWSPREPSQDGRDPWTVYLCHRCRHAFPSSRLQRCTGRGCGNFYCQPCTSERSGGLGSGGGGSRGRSRGARWSSQPPQASPPPPREAFGGPADIGQGGERDEHAAATKPWMGPCCEGRCGCRECITGAEEGLLCGWRALNGLASAVTKTGAAGGSRSGKARATPPQKTARAAGSGDASTPASKKKVVGWSGWQAGSHGAEANPEPAVARGNGTAGGEGEGRAPPLACVEEEAGDGGGDDGEHGSAAEGAGVEWCRSCSGPGPAGSLARCYYCYRGVHASGCRRFEEALARRRLEQFGLGPAGQFAVPPTGDGAVGHGVAVCVRGRWRAGLVLCWSPTLRAHYVRYVDGSGGVGQGAEAAPGLDAVPWDGEWVALPVATASGKAGREATSSRGADSAKRFAAFVEASGVRWPLVEVALRLFPPATTTPLSPSSGQAVDKPPPESRPATKVLKSLLKRNFLASQRATAGGQYRPPAVAIPSGVGPGARDGAGGMDGASAAGNGTEQARTLSERQQQPWACRACIEAKLHRLQRRVRSQFFSPGETPGKPVMATTTAAKAARTGMEESSATVASSAAGPRAHSVAIDGPTTPSKGSPPVRTPADGGTPKLERTPRPPAEQAIAGGGETPSPALPVGESSSGGNRASAGGKRPREEVSPPAVSMFERQGPGIGSGRSGEAREGEGEKPVTEPPPPPRGPAPRAVLKKGRDKDVDDVDGDGDTRPSGRPREDRRLRWLPAGNPGSARPFALEAGFLSDLAGMHASGAPTASGADVGTSRSGSRGGRKRPRPPPVARAFSHLLGKLEAQSSLAFALPPDVTGLDGDMAAFFAGGSAGGGGGGRRRSGTSGYEGPFDDEARGAAPSVVLVDGTAAVAMAVSTGAEVMAVPAAAGVAAFPGGGKLLQQQGRQGGKAGGAGGVGVSVGGGGGRADARPGAGFGGAGAGAAAAALPQIPAGFVTVKEVDLESSARIRPLDSSSKLRRRSSSFGGGVRNTSRLLRMCSTEAPSAVGGGGSSLPGGGGGGGAGSAGRAGASAPTTLKDVSRKDRMQRMDQRRMRRQGQTLVDAGLLNVDVLQSRRKKLRFGRSSVHAWGVFADEPIAAGDLVIEYRGEIIGNAVADKREKMYEDMQIGSDYMFRVDEDTVVDATFKGSLARFINHSCDPSCTTRIIAVEGSKKIVIYAERDVQMGEELSYDYKFPLEPDEAARVPCHCGTEKCRGFIN